LFGETIAEQSIPAVVVVATRDSSVVVNPTVAATAVSVAAVNEIPTDAVTYDESVPLPVAVIVADSLVVEELSTRK